MQKNSFEKRLELSYAPYTKKWALTFYDWLVTHYSNRFVWKCPAKNMVEQYHMHTGNTHLDIGVGSGYYLLKCGYLAKKLHLMDLSSLALDVTEKRSKHKDCTKIKHNVFNEFPVQCAKYDSIAMNYLLHCMPGTLSKQKSSAISNAVKCLKDGGVLFGSMILNAEYINGFMGKIINNKYKQMGIFNNMEDTPEDLEKALKKYLTNVNIKRVGNVLLFSGVK